MALVQSLLRYAAFAPAGTALEGNNLEKNQKLNAVPALLGVARRPPPATPDT